MQDTAAIFSKEGFSYFWQITRGFTSSFELFACRTYLTQLKVTRTKKILMRRVRRRKRRRKTKRILMRLRMKPT